MAVDAYLHTSRQRIEIALTTHRAALTHRQLLMAALDALGPHIGLRTPPTRARAVTAFGLDPLRRLRGIRRRFSGRRVGSADIGFEDGTRVRLSTTGWTRGARPPVPAMA